MLSRRSLTPAILLVLVGQMVAATAADAGWFGRARDAVAEIQARRGWVIFEPVPTAGGDLELLAISVLTHDPVAPAFLVRFQATDADRVVAKIRVGDQLTVRKYTVLQVEGQLPVYVVEPYSERGWRTRQIPGETPFLAQWSYLVAGRALAGHQPDFDAFFDRRPDQRTLLERDVALVYRATFGVELDGEGLERSAMALGPFTVPDGEGEVSACRAYVDHVDERLGRAAALLDQVLALGGHDHHGVAHVHVDDAAAKARRALELIEEARRP